MTPKSKMALRHAWIIGDPYGGLPFPTYGVLLGKEKRSHIGARIFPNPMFQRISRRGTTEKHT